MTSGSIQPTVGEICDTSFVSQDENVLIADAAKTLYEREGDSIIVTRNDPKMGIRIPIGIVTQRDIIFRVVAQNKGPFKVTVGSIMSSPVTAIDRHSPVGKALELMKQKGFTRLPVVTKTSEIIGVVTMEMVVRKVPLKKISQA
jgi:CBS domain-containing protein